MATTTKGGLATSGGINPPLKWHRHGGKHYLASKIIALMPPHVHYVEPYFGGGAVLLAKNPEGVSEVVNDINGTLTNFWFHLQDDSAFEAFKRQVEAIPFSEQHFEDAKARLSIPGLTEAVAFFIRCRQSMSGRMKGFAPLSRTRARRGMNEQAAAWLTAIEGLPAVHERLKRVVILNRNGPEVIRSQDGPDTLFYCDPPYLHETRATTGEYEHEMTTGQHVELLGTLAGIKGKFLLSGYRHPIYDEMATCHNWHRTDFDLPNNAAGGKSKRRMTESVWHNFEVTR